MVFCCMQYATPVCLVTAGCMDAEEHKLVQGGLFQSRVGRSDQDGLYQAVGCHKPWELRMTVKYNWN